MCYTVILRNFQPMAERNHQYLPTNICDESFLYYIEYKFDMLPKTRRKTLAVFIGTVAVVLTIAFAPFNTILVPSFTIHDSTGYSTISGNLSNESKSVYYYGKDVQSTSIITEHGMPNSTFSLNLTTVFANYEPLWSYRWFRYHYNHARNNA